jgi:hypothetical protein
MTTAEMADRWLDRLYRGKVALTSRQPVRETAATDVFACSYSTAAPLVATEAMLTGAVAVPLNGPDPYHLATDDPWADLAATEADPRLIAPAQRVRRTNARGAVVATHAAVNRSRATALAWKPSDEAQGWWPRLLQWFPPTESATASNWDEIIVEARRRGPDTRGVVWIRRAWRALEITGHLIYLHNDCGNVVFLDGQRGGLARLETDGVRELRVALFFQPRPDPSSAVWPAEAPAESYHAAVAKAQSWLRQSYDERVDLVRPSPQDEGRQGWVFPCNTHRFLDTGDWQYAMVDAAIAVPRSVGEPMLVPNTAPLEWIAQWKDGSTPGRDIAAPSQPADAAWLSPTLKNLGGTALQEVECKDFPAVLRTLEELPPGSRALVWVRRHDQRGREITGELLVGMRTSSGIIVTDPKTNTPAVPGLDATQIQIIRYR